MANLTCGVSSLQAHVLRVTKLNADGSVDTGNPQGTYIFDQLVTLNITPEITEGQTIEQVLASGVTCVKFQDKDRLTGFSFEMELCSWDAELMSVLGLGAGVLSEATDSIGFDFGGDSATTCSASSSTAAPVAFEVWTKAYQCTGPVTGYAYIRWVFPYVEFAFRNDAWAVQNGVMLFSVGGTAKSNASYPAAGAHDDSPFAITSLGAFFLSNAAPTATCGYVATPTP